jgi:hypothetical protein
MNTHTFVIVLQERISPLDQIHFFSFFFFFFKPLRVKALRLVYYYRFFLFSLFVMKLVPFVVGLWNWIFIGCIALNDIVLVWAALLNFFLFYFFFVRNSILLFIRLSLLLLYVMPPLICMFVFFVKQGLQARFGLKHH